MRGSIWSREEICETSGLPNPMVSGLHQCNGFIKRKLPAWRVQKCIALVSAETVLTSAGPQTTPCHGGQYRVQRGNFRNFGPTNPMVPRLHQCNGYIKKKLPAWRVQKCIELVGADTLPAPGRKLPRVMGGSIGSREEICETSGLPNPMVPRLHQCNGYIKRKLPAWRVQKCIALVGADTVLTSAGP